MNSNGILLFLIIFCSSISYAQVSISGLVKDDIGQEVIGANVFIKGTYDGGSTDIDGTFTFKTMVKGIQTLVITYIGFKDYELELNLDQPIDKLDIKLSPTASKLKEIIITAGAFEASDEKKGVVLNPIDIVTTAGALGDIAGALNTLPGTQRVGETGQLFVRGGAASETTTFIDGLRVQNPFTGTVADVPSRGRFSPFLFKGTIFSTGGYSAEYGQALSSALILNTNDLATETTTSIALMSIGGSLAHTHAWGKSSLQIDGSYVDLGPYINLVPQRREWHKPFRSKSGQAIYRYKTSETGIFKFYTTYNRSSLEFDYADLINIGQQNQLSLTNNNLYINSTWKESIGKNWILRAGIGFGQDDQKVKELFSLDEKENTFQAKVTLQHFLSEKVTIKTGVEHINNSFDQYFRNRISEEFNNDIVENYSAAFIESDIYLSRRFAAKLGGRIERSEILNRYNVAPRVSLAYKTGTHSQISTAYGLFYQNPINDLLIFNQDVDFEKADHYIVNFQYNKSQRIFRIEGYYKIYDQLIKHPSNEQWLSGNSGDGYARGIDIFFRDRKSVKFGDYWISYSYLDTERNYLDFPYDATPHFASTHNASLVYKHWFNEITTSLSMSYSLASGRPYNDPNVSAFNSGRTKTFQDLSINLSHLTNIKGQFTVIFASMTNVPGFDQEFGYRFSSEQNMEGVYPSFVLKPDAKRFFFIGMFVSIGQTFNKDEQVKPD